MKKLTALNIFRLVTLACGGAIFALTLTGVIGIAGYDGLAATLGGVSAVLFVALENF